jgi:general secretion pathway protein I
LKANGFTLLEVLVALAVLAVALAALLKAGAESTRSVSYLRDRTIAGWVAANAVNQVWLRGSLPSGGQRGTQFMAGREWRWELQISPTADPDLRRLDVRVSGIDDAAVLTELTAFLRADQ